MSARTTGPELTAQSTQVHAMEFVGLDVLALQARAVYLVWKTLIGTKMDSVSVIRTGGWTTAPCMREIVMESAMAV